MSGSMPQSYAAAMQTGNDAPCSSSSKQQQCLSTDARSTASPQSNNNDARKRADIASHKSSTSPSHIPRTSAPEKDVYILTFLTSPELHRRMTDLRKEYFPPKLNHLDAHLTLFHALPGSKLEDEIIPTLEQVAASEQGFSLLAATPFKLRKGIAIGFPKTAGGDEARGVHSRLKDEWRAFLSDQDAGGFAAHYTIMNKVDRDEDVDRAFTEVEGSWRAVRGMVLGLSLWKYERSRWIWHSEYRFAEDNAAT